MPDQETKRTIRTEDGVEVGEGDRAFDYYSMKVGTVGKIDTHQEREDVYHEPLMQGSVLPWFDFKHDEGGNISLNGQRICTIEHAKKMGWIK